MGFSFDENCSDANKNKQNPVTNEGEDDARLQVKPEESVQQKVIVIRELFEKNINF